MKRTIIIAALLFLAGLGSVSCYEDFIKDYDQPNMGFALQRQVRTVIESKNSIFVGVSIGGKREVDLNDWATFEIDESLLEGTGKKLLPADYYSLADPNTFRVRRTGMAVADVQITFTDAFYADPASLNGSYAIPFRITGVSIPASRDSTGYTNPVGAVRAGAETTIVAVKYINEYSGTWYKMGEMTEVDASGNALGEKKTYGDRRDIINSPTTSLTTTGRYELKRVGIADTATGNMSLSFMSPGNDESLLNVSGSGISNASAKIMRKGDYTFYSGTEPSPQIELEYVYETGGKRWKVNETLVLRKWAELELTVETF